jgi:hypothetical protein
VFGTTREARLVRVGWHHRCVIRVSAAGQTRQVCPLCLWVEDNCYNRLTERYVAKG